MNELIKIEQQDGRQVVSSREVAEKFGKRHSDVMRDIRNIVKGCPQNCVSLFIDSKYQNKQNKQEYDEYLMTRDGFSLLAMGFTGQEALQWKLKFIDAFNKMEQQLQVTSKEKLLIGLFSNDPLEVANSHKALVQLETKPLVEKIETQKQVIDTVIKDDGIYAISDVGRILKSYSSSMGAVKIFAFLRDSKILLNEPETGRHNLPFATYSKYFKTKIVNKGDSSYSKTYFTGNGLKWFLDKLVKQGHMTLDNKEKAKKHFVKESD